MRKLPVIQSISKFPSASESAQNISAGMEVWRKNHTINAKNNPQLTKDNQSSFKNNNMAIQNNTQESGTTFTLRTEAGVLSFKQTSDGTYTDFARVAIEMMLAFNANEIDPEFKKAITFALQAYESGDTDLFDDSEEIDFLGGALGRQQNESAKFEEATKHVSILPESDTLTLQILASEDNDMSSVSGIISRNTDLSPHIIHAAVRSNEPFTLPFEKAKELYIQLRTLDVVLTIKPSNKENGMTTKKVAAAKKQNSKKSDNTTLSEKKIKPSDGVIK